MKSCLACNSQRWLLIIDNADDREIDYSKYKPPGKRGDILFTTRNPECVTHQTVGSEALGDLQPDLARELLLQATNIAESRWKEKEKAATAVVNILGLHTLAIIQAGAFVRQKLCTLEQYPIVFQQQKEQLLKFHSKQNVSTYGNVYTTFEVSAEHLQTSQLLEDLDALDFLHILAFMHNSGISETMFRRASEYASELRDMGTVNDEDVLSLSVRHVARLPEYAQQGWSRLQDRMRWRNACAILESLSIVTIHEDEDEDSITVSAHSLVHAWAKERQDYQSQCRAWQSAATILALSCEGWYRYCPFFIVLQPHLQACVSHELEDYTQNLSDMEAAQIFFLFAYVFYATNEQSSLSLLVQRIRLRLQDRYEADQEIKLQINLFTAELSRQQGNYGEAVELLEHVVKVREKLTEDDPSRLISEHNLADAYQANGQIEEAIELLEHLVKIDTNRAKDDPDRLDSQHELASAYQANGQVDEAIELLEHVVKIQEKLAEDHPSRLVAEHNLARAYQANGQIDEAIELLEHVAKIQEKLTEDYPDRLASQHELASAYQANGQIDDAIELLEHVVKIRKEKLVEDHPDRLTSEHNLANAYQANRRIDEAIELLEYVVSIRKEKLAEDHFSRLISEHNLADAYQANGRIDDAIELLEHVVKIRKEKLVEDHPDRLTSEHNLANAYQANRRIDEAIELLEYVVSIRKEKLAEDHFSRLISEHNLADAYQANGRIDEAIELLEHVVKIAKEKLAEDHPHRLASEDLLAYVYQENGQAGEAIELLEHVVKIRKEKLAEDHPHRLASEDSLAYLYEENGQADEA